jgi:branched-chain amino acid transport system substrate-binding protein
MVNKKPLAILVIVIIALAAAIGAWQLTTNSTPKKTIKIGLVAPESTSIGQDMDRAARLAVDQINAAGGIYVKDWGVNATITLVLADTQDDSAANAVTPVTRAVTTDKVDLLIGGYASPGTLADEIVAITNRVPYIITGASSQLVTRRGPQGNYGGLAPNDTSRVTDAEGMSYMFHYCATTLDYSKTIADWFATGMKPVIDSTYNFNASRNLRLAVIYITSSFGSGVFSGIQYWMNNESLPISLVANQTFPAETLNFQTYLTAIKAATPDAVLVVSNPSGFGPTPDIIKQGLNDVGLKTLYVVTENNEDPAYYSGLGQDGQGQVLESKFSPFAGAYIPLVVPYVSAYEAKYPGLVPGMMGCDTYDAVYIAKNAIERAGTVEKKAVRDALETTNMDIGLIMTQSCKIQFSTGINYHEIQPITFMEQLAWNQTAGICQPKIIWTPPEAPTLASIKQADFALPANYQPGSP